MHHDEIVRILAWSAKHDPHIRLPPDTADSQQLPDSATESLLQQCVHAPTHFRVNQEPSLLDLLFVKFPSLTSPITIQPPIGKYDIPLQ